MNRDNVRTAAYGAAFSAALVRLGHGQLSGRWLPDGYTTETVDARAEAKRIATEHAELAVASLDEPAGETR